MASVRCQPIEREVAEAGVALRLGMAGEEPPPRHRLVRLPGRQPGDPPLYRHPGPGEGIRAGGRRAIIEQQGCARIGGEIARVGGQRRQEEERRSGRVSGHRHQRGEGRAGPGLQRRQRGGAGGAEQGAGKGDGGKGLRRGHGILGRRSDVRG